MENSNKNIVVGGIILLIGLGIGYGVGVSSMSKNMNHGGNSMTITDMMHSMSASLEGKKGVEFDKAFIDEMIVHHEGAVDMAEQALKNADHQEIKDLANDIITAQNKEIAQMKNWRELWF